MDVPVNANPEAPPLVRKETEPFFDKHFAKIAFAISALALLTIAPIELFLGALAGLWLHSYTKENVDPNGKIITLPNTLFTLVGATAALLRLTPGGAAGGYIFLAIPFLGSLAVGATAYRAFNKVLYAKVNQ